MRLLSPLLLGVSLFFTTPVFAFELAHSEGSVALAEAPRTIVAYDLAVLDSLHTLGVAVAGVPQPAELYTGPLQPLSQGTFVGTLFEPDYAVLAKMQPELIFAGSRSQSEMGKLNNIAPTAFMRLDEPYMAHFRQHNLALGKAFNKQQEAEHAVRNVESNVAQLAQRNEGKTGAFLFVVNDRVIPHAPGDRFGFAYEVSGLTAVLPARAPGQATAARPAPGTPEALQAQQANEKAVQAVAQAEPDWLLVLDRGALNGAPRTAANTLAAHPALSATQAFQTGQVVYLDTNAWYVVGGGLTTMADITAHLLTLM